METSPSPGLLADPLNLRNRKLVAAKVLVDILRRFPATRRISPIELPIGDVARLLHAAVGGAALETSPEQSGSSTEGIGVYVALASGTYRYDRCTRLLSMVSPLDIRVQLSALDQLPLAPLNLLYVACTAQGGCLRAEDTTVLSALNTAALCEHVDRFCKMQGLVAAARGWLARNLLSASVGMAGGEYLLLAQSIGRPQGVPGRSA